MNVFAAILADNGFTPTRYDFDATIAGFDYDLQFALFDQDTVFDIEQSKIIRQRDNPAAYLRCELITQNASLDDALLLFLKRWVSELRYNNVTREILDITQLPESIEIRALLISPHNAMTFHISIKQPAKESL
jgi:hypothetical protein